MSRKLTHFACSLCAIFCYVFSSSFSVETDFDAMQYINTYKDIAIAEMHRTGIPASIKLAQGMHESQYGKSRLATQANNHFGIKCKTYWTGGKFYHKDDDYKNGELINSCFRSYSTELDSYIDHSNFLVHSERYASLFEHDRTEYEKWAYGLKTCGYATDLRYTKKLISKIEKYNLNQYDWSPNPFAQAPSNY